MKVFSIVWLLLLAALLYVLFFATFGDDSSVINRALSTTWGGGGDGTIMVGCSNVVQTRGGTICLDNAYKR